MVADRWDPATLSSSSPLLLDEDRGHGHQNAIVVAGRRHEEFSATLSSEVHGHGHQHATVVAARWQSSLPLHGTSSASLTRGPRSGQDLFVGPLEVEEKVTEVEENEGLSVTSNGVSGAIDVTNGLAKKKEEEEDPQEEQQCETDLEVTEKIQGILRKLQNPLKPSAEEVEEHMLNHCPYCLLYTSPSPRD